MKAFPLGLTIYWIYEFGNFREFEDLFSTDNTHIHPACPYSSISASGLSVCFESSTFGSNDTNDVKEIEMRTLNGLYVPEHRQYCVVNKERAPYRLYGDSQLDDRKTGLLILAPAPRLRCTLFCLGGLRLLVG
eukprot:2724051-Pleurochrysis_carterae.AAC.1